jgi:predicted metal-dependent hydrolase
VISKKSVDQIDPAQLSEPHLDDEGWRNYVHGWQLFNERKFWHAHEAWEYVWKRDPSESRIFFQGIIQLAAAYHLLTVPLRYSGMMRNFDKAEEKLKLFPLTFLDVDVKGLLDAIAVARGEIARIGRDHLNMFPTGLIPVVPLPGRS